MHVECLKALAAAAAAVDAGVVTYHRSHVLLKIAGEKAEHCLSFTGHSNLHALCSDAEGPTSECAGNTTPLSAVIDKSRNND